MVDTKDNEQQNGSDENGVEKDPLAEAMSETEDEQTPEAAEDGAEKA